MMACGYNGEEHLLLLYNICKYEQITTKGKWANLYRSPMIFITNNYHLIQQKYPAKVYLTASPYCFISTHLFSLDGNSNRN